MPQPYESALEQYGDYQSIIAVYLQEYLSWLDQGRTARMLYDPYGETTFSQEDAQELLMFRLFALSQQGQRQVRLWEEEIQKRVEQTTCFLPLEYLCRSLEIPNEGKLLLVTALLGCTQPGFGRVFGMFHQAPQPPFLSMHDALTLFYGQNLAQLRQAQRSYLPLVFDYDPKLPELDRVTLSLNKRILDFLLGDGILKEFSWGKPFSVLDPLPEQYGRRQELEFLCRAVQSGTAMQIVLQGEPGSGRSFLVKHACRKCRKNVLFVSWEQFCKLPQQEGKKQLLRELRLQQALCCFTGMEVCSDLPRLEEVEQEIFPVAPVIFFTSESPLTLPTQFVQHSFHLGDGDFACSLGLWSASGFPLDPQADPAQLAGKYQLTPGQICRVLQSCENQCRLQGKAFLSQGEIERACMDLAGDCMGDRAVRLNTGYTMEDLILPPEEKQQIQEGMDHLRYRHVVYDQWGFQNKLSYGGGLSMLFEGPPGTGKTMAASIVGNELGLSVFKVDISKMMSKYIGETEKSLGEVFDIAAKNNAVLFFDETDALFGKRSDIKDSHDKYANIETSYLLQKMEEFQGVVIMTTNLLSNIDQAFLRRISYIIHFPFPDASQRLQLWKSVFPKQARLDETPDYPFLAETFEMTGAMIKNSAVSAAFLAAAQHRGVTMKDLLYAIQKQFSKHGKTINAKELGPYGMLIR